MIELSKKRVLQVAFPALVIAFFTLLFSALYLSRPQPEKRVVKPKKTNVFVIRSQSAERRLSVRSQGEVLPLSLLELKAEVPGKISFISPRFVAGGQFTKGELLLQIDPASYQLAVEAQRADVISAEQKYQIAKAESEAAVAELRKMGRANASELARGVPQLRDAKAHLDSAKADLKRAELDLSRTRLVAPFNGRVMNEVASPGQYIHQNTTVATLFSTDVAEVRLPLTLEEATQIGLPLTYYQDGERNQFEVKLSAELGGDVQTWKAKIVRTEAAVDAKTRNIFTVARIDAPYKNPNAPLLMGSFVQAEIFGTETKIVTKLPSKTLRNGEDLWLVNDDKTLHISPVDVVQRERDFVFLSGLPNGAKVVTSTIPIPVEGMKLRPIKEARIKAKKEEVVYTPIKLDEVNAADEKKLKAKDANKQILKSAG